MSERVSFAGEFTNIKNRKNSTNGDLILSYKRSSIDPAASTFRIRKQSMPTMRAIKGVTPRSISMLMEKNDQDFDNHQDSDNNS